MSWLEWPRRVTMEPETRRAARLIWRDRFAAGLVFPGAGEAGGVIPLNWARKLRASERANR